MGIRDTLKTLLDAYAEGQRMEQLGPDYRERKLLNQARVAQAHEQMANAPLRRQSLEQGLERGGLSIDALKREAEDYARRQEVVRRLGLEGFDVAPQAFQYAEGQGRREAQDRLAGTQADIAGRQLETMPSAEEAQAERAANRGYRQSMAQYYAGGGRAAASRYTGRPVDEEIILSAQQDALEELSQEGGPLEGVYRGRDGQYYTKKTGMFGLDIAAGDEPFEMTPQHLAMLRAAVLEKLRGSGYSDDAIAKAGLEVGGGGGSTELTYNPATGQVE